MRKGDEKGPFGEEGFGSLRPFNCANASLVKILLEPEGEKIGGSFDPVEIEVVERQRTGILIEIDESGTLNGRIDPQSEGKALDEGCFPCAQLAREGEDRIRREMSCDCWAELLGLLLRGEINYSDSTHFSR